jgi:DNA-binding Xre family transcriptional regulator
MPARYENRQASVPILTAAKSSVGSTFRGIERRRLELGVSKERLVAAAGISRRTYQRAQNTRSRKIQRRTVDALDRALEQLAGTRSAKASQLASLHRAAMILIAKELRLDPESVLATDFTRQRPMDKPWLAAARVRRDAMAVVAVDLGVRHSDLARAIGVSKQNVGQAVDQVYDKREADPLFEAMLARIGRLLGG